MQLGTDLLILSHLQYNSIHSCIRESIRYINININQLNSTSKQNFGPRPMGTPWQMNMQAWTSPVWKGKPPSKASGFMFNMCISNIFSCVSHQPQMFFPSKMFLFPARSWILPGPLLSWHVQIRNWWLGVLRVALGWKLPSWRGPNSMGENNKTGTMDFFLKVGILKLLEPCGHHPSYPSVICWITSN